MHSPSGIYEQSGGEGLSARRRSHLIWLLGVGVFIIAVIAALVGWAMRQSRLAAHHSTEIAAENLSTAMANDIGGMFRRIDFGLLALQDELSRPRDARPWDRAAMDAVLAREDRRHPEVVGFRIFGPDGRMVGGVGNVANRNIDISDRDYFQTLRDQPESGLVVAPPLFGRASRRWLIGLARRITNPDGSFGGVVYAAIPADVMKGAFAALKIGGNGVILLAHRNFKIAAWFPVPPGMKDPVGTEGISDTLRSIIASGVPSAQYDATSPVDGVLRTVSVRKIGLWPYHILVALAEDDYLADWKNDRTRLLLFGGLMVSLVVAGMVVIHKRIAGWRQATDALAESERRFKTLVNNIPQKVFLKDANSNYLTCNAAYARDLELEEQDIAGHTDFDFFPHALAEKYRRDDAEVMASRTVRDMEESYFHAGRELTVQTVKVPIEDERSAVVGVLGIFWDITARKSAEQALLDKTEALSLSNADLEQFAYVASHDLQTPLRNIVSFTQLLETRYKGRFDADADEFIGFVVNSSKQMSKLISDLLEYSRIAGWNRELQRVPVAEAVAQALENLKQDMEITDGEIVLGDLPCVMGEPTLLASLFQNLIGNALKYRAPDRRPIISVTAELQAPDLWRFAIADNGIGIDPQYFTKIFEMFQRLHPQSESEGTGIGLTLCRRIIHRLGGRIWVQSEPGKGTAACHVDP